MGLAKLSPKPAERRYAGESAALKGRAAEEDAEAAAADAEADEEPGGARYAARES